LPNLGALWPLLDEYSKESDRTAFIQKHANTLLTGVPLDYLVYDPNGPIAASDLRDEMRSSLQVPEGDRFRLETRPFQSWYGVVACQDFLREQFFGHLVVLFLQ
jgi:hypothetical protein